MATRVEGSSVTIPAGTSQGSPLTTSLPIKESIVRKLDIIVPPGPSGLMGFYLAHSGTQMIPRTAGQYLILNDHLLTFDMDGYPTGNKWTLVGYNTDFYPHTIQLVWHVDEVTQPQNTIPQFRPIG